MPKILFCASTALALALLLSHGPRLASAEEEAPKPKDCWEKVWPDKEERDKKRKVVTDAIGLMKTKAEDTTLPLKRRKWLDEACKVLLEMYKNGQVCPACIQELGLAYPLAKPPRIVLQKESLCAPEDPEERDPTAEVPATMAHEFGHIKDSGPMMKEYCIPYEKYCEMFANRTGPGIPAKPTPGSQAEKEMKIMCRLYSIASGLDEVEMRILEMMYGPYLDQPQPEDVEYFACTFYNIACTNLEDAENLLGELPSTGQPAVPGFNKAKAEKQLAALKALKEQIALKVAEAREQHPNRYDDEWPYEEEPETQEGEDD